MALFMDTHTIEGGVAAAARLLAADVDNPALHALLV
jgi:hypothetical protein